MRNAEERRKEETKATLGLWVRNGQITDFPSRALPRPRSVGMGEETTGQLRNSL